MAFPSFFFPEQGGEKKERNLVQDFATYHAIDTSPVIGTSGSKIKKVVISGYIFAYIFEDVLGLSSSLKACHLITPLSSMYSPVRTCQAPPRQLVMTEGFPRSSWCRELGICEYLNKLL